MRKRIVTLTLAAAVLAIRVFGLPLAIGVAKYYLDDERAELERVADSTALSVADDLAAHPQSVQIPATGTDTGLALYAPNGKLLAGDGPPTADDIVTRTYSGTPAHGTPNGSLVFATPVTDNGILVGVVRAATPRMKLYVRTGLTWLGMLGLAVADLDRQRHRARTGTQSRRSRRRQALALQTRPHPLHPPAPHRLKSAPRTASSAGSSATSRRQVRRSACAE